jgi:tRNA(fMet)-specific endonuclease VapC
MLRNYLLDTDISSYLLRGGHHQLHEKYRYSSPDGIFISVVTQAELLYGLKPLPFTHPRRSEVQRFIDLMEVLPWDSLAAEAYADIRFSLTRSGRTIGELDMMIAGHALSRGYTLVSNNTRHYERIVPPLKLENWTEA